VTVKIGEESLQDFVTAMLAVRRRPVFIDAIRREEPVFGHEAWAPACP